MDTETKAQLHAESIKLKRYELKGEDVPRVELPSVHFVTGELPVMEPVAELEIGRQR